MEKLTQARSSVALEQGLPEAEKAKVLELYDQAILFAEQKADVVNQYESVQHKVNTGISRLTELEAELDATLEDKSQESVVRPTESIEVIEQEILQTEIARREMSQQLAEQQSELVTIAAMFRQLDSDIQQSNNRIEQINADLSASDFAGESSVLSEARKAALLARKELRESEVLLFKIQQENESLLMSLARKELELTKSRVKELSDTLEKQRASALALRQQLARDAVTKAVELEKSLSDSPPAVTAFIAEHVRLLREYESMLLKEYAVLGVLEQSLSERDALKGIFEATRRRVEISGSTSSVGRMLRKRLVALPASHSYLQQSEKRRKEINRVADRQIQMDETLFESSASENAIENFITIQSEDKVKQHLVSSLKRIQGENKRIQEELRGAYSRYLSELNLIDSAQVELLQVSQEFISYIREKLLWIRSTTVTSIKDVTYIPQALDWLATRSHWQSAYKVLQEETRLHPLITIVGLVFALFALLMRRRAITRLGLVAKETVKIRTDRFSLTVVAVLLTLLLSTGSVSLLATVGYQLNQKAIAPDYFPSALGKALLICALVLLISAFFRQLTRKDGLAERHFRWPDAIRIQLRVQLQWLTPVATLLTFIAVFTNETQQTSLVPSFGRPAFVLLMLALLLFCVRVFRHSGPLACYQREKHPRYWVTQLRVIWYPLLLLIPMVLMIACLAGYHHSALYVSYHLLLTVALVLFMFVVKELMLRSLYIDERKRKFEESLKRREEFQAQKALLEQGGATTQSPDLPQIEEDEVSYEQLSEQAKRLLTTSLLFGVIMGVWSIWSDLLPALGFLDAVKLPITTTELVDGIEKQSYVTLADLGIGVLIAFVTLFAAKNLPGVLELSVLQHLPLDAGGRYALTTLAQYLIVAFGVLATFSMIGAEWSSVQWLVAALSVGLGFGLQEIFANFISGLIILFERPIRVGDTVTVAGFSGTVTRIRTRATTIVDWDRKEIIVPNKNFITERVTNWTLTDAITRVIIPIGIAHGSDTGKAYRVIAETAKSNPLVLSDPEIQLFFLGIDSSTLRFELRVFVRQLDDRLPVTHEIYMAINEALRDNGIKIPFSQLDVHIKNSDQGAVPDS